MHELRWRWELFGILVDGKSHQLGTAGRLNDICHDGLLLRIAVNFERDPERVWRFDKGIFADGGHDVSKGYLARERAAMDHHGLSIAAVPTVYFDATAAFAQC